MPRRWYYGREIIYKLAWSTWRPDIILIGKLTKTVSLTNFEAWGRYHHIQRADLEQVCIERILANDDSAIFEPNQFDYPEYHQVLVCLVVFLNELKTIDYRLQATKLLQNWHVKTSLLW